MKKVLAIEDDLTMLKILESRFALWPDIEFLTALDPDEGVRKVKEERPDLVLLDVILPGKTGLEVLRLIRQDPQTKPIPVIVFTMVGRGELVEQLKMLGVSGHIVKGMTPLDEAMEQIRNVLGIAGHPSVVETGV